MKKINIEQIGKIREAYDKARGSDEWYDYAMYSEFRFLDSNKWHLAVAMSCPFPSEYCRYYIKIIKDEMYIYVEGKEDITRYYVSKKVKKMLEEMNIIA